MARPIRIDTTTLGGQWGDKMRKLKAHRVVIQTIDGGQYDAPVASRYTRIAQAIDNGTVAAITGYNEEGQTLAHATFKVRANAEPVDASAGTTINVATQAAATPAPSPAVMASPPGGGGGQNLGATVGKERSIDAPPWADAMEAVAQTERRSLELLGKLQTQGSTLVSTAYEFAINSLLTANKELLAALKEAHKVNNMLRHELLARPYVELASAEVEQDDEPKTLGTQVGQIVGDIASAALATVGQNVKDARGG